MSDTRSGISRRTLAKGAAWAAPAVAVAAAAPAFAKSGGPPNVTVMEACKQPGASCAPEFTKGYTFTVRLTNPTNETIWVYLPTSGTYSPYFQYTSGVIFDFDSAREYFPGTPDTLGTLVDPLMLTAGQTRYIAVDGGATGNSGNTSAAGVLWFAWGHSSTAGGDLDHPYTPSPWGGGSGPFGEGWRGGPFNIAAFPPCDKKNNCIPTSTPVTTTTTVLLAGRQALTDTTTVSSETTTVSTDTTTVATETTTVATETTTVSSETTTVSTETTTATENPVG